MRLVNMQFLIQSQPAGIIRAEMEIHFGDFSQVQYLASLGHQMQRLNTITECDIGGDLQEWSDRHRSGGQCTCAHHWLSSSLLRARFAG